jgi:hypothetical protein
VACFDWLVRVPRGPVLGCHVAPHYWFVGFSYVKFGLVSPGVEPATSGQGNGLMKVGLTGPPAGGSC